MTLKYINIIRSICKEISSSILKDLPNIVSEVFEESIIEIIKNNFLKKLIKYDIEKIEYYYDFEATESYGCGSIDIYLNNDSIIEITQECPQEQLLKYKNKVKCININKLEECLILLERNKNNILFLAYTRFKQLLLLHRKTINYYLNDYY